MHLVQILSLCPGFNNALGTNSSGQLTLRSANQPYDPASYWLLHQGFTPQGGPVGAVLQHRQTGYCLAAQPGGGLVFGPIQQFDGWSTWTFGQLPNGAFALRPFNDEDWNLNVLGGCGNSGIGLWGWDGGQANETWRFVIRSSFPAPPPPTRYKIQSGCADFKGNHYGLALGTNPPVVCGSPSIENMIWNVEVALSPTGQLMGGVAILNTKNGQALRCMGSNTLVGFGNPGNLDGWSLWTFGGGDPYVAVRPLANDDQNLNVKDGCAAGAPICTWGWGGGDSNEIWSFVRLE